MVSVPAPRNVLFVCTGNTCRSPMAEVLFRQKVSSLCLPWDAKSAGLSAWPGDTAAPDAVEIMREMDIDLSRHRSSPVSQWAMDWATDIFAMTKEHCKLLAHAFPERAADIRLFTEPRAELTLSKAADIPDPFGKGRNAYQRVAVEMEEAVSCLIDFLKGK